MTFTALGLSALCALVPPVDTTQAGTPTVIVVRHAEAIPDAGRDPALAAHGAARAQALADALDHADVAAVYATQYQRTQLTGAPAAAARGLAVTVKPIEGDADAYAAKLAAEILAAHAGTVLIVGHSNTVPALVKAFSGLVIPDLAHDSYDAMFVIAVRGPGHGSAVRARYGR